MSNDPAASPHRIERVLTVSAAVVIGVSVLAIVAVFIGRAAGADFSDGIWRVVLLEPLTGFPIGILLILAFVVVSGMRRRREARNAG